jgi:hypothetical protein
MKWFLVLLACTLGAASYDPLYAELEEWVIRNGGEVERKAGNESKKDVITKPSTPLPLQVRTRIGVNHQGIRGLFAKEDVPAGGYFCSLTELLFQAQHCKTLLPAQTGQPLVTVTGSSIINAGSMEGSFLVSLGKTSCKLLGQMAWSAQPRLRFYIPPCNDPERHQPLLVLLPVSCRLLHSSC